LIRGKISNFYPYYFVNAGNLGLPKVLIIAVGIAALFYALSALFIRVGKAMKNRS
jgi:hypothetical protein